jgi:hypothetical protein|nr:MAG TPA: hypothetical protein [Caudoviricetes sp.]
MAVDATRKLFGLLKAAIPELPENITKMSIHLNSECSPLIECEFQVKANIGVETHDQKFSLIAIDGTHNVR